MYTHFFEIRMYREPDKHYWTVGLKIQACSWINAMKQVKAWGFGIKTFSSLDPVVQHIHDKALRDKGYFALEDFKKIEAELQDFMLKGDEKIDELKTSAGNEKPLTAEFFAGIEIKIDPKLPADIIEFRHPDGRVDRFSLKTGLETPQW